MSRLLLASLLFLAPVAASADATLVGRTATFSILTYDDPGAPLFMGHFHTARVDEGVDFALGREGAQNDIDVVPISVDISANRIEIRFAPAGHGELFGSAFNGYVLSFDGDCPVLGYAKVDEGFTNMPIGADGVSSKATALFINVAGLGFDGQSRLAVDLTVADCPVL